MYVYICVAIHRMTQKGAHLKVAKIANDEVFFISRGRLFNVRGAETKTRPVAGMLVNI